MNSHLVVVEDEPSVSEVLREVLELDGFSVLCFNHPDHVRTLDASMPPAIFLIDLMLPGRSGVELASMLREYAYPKTPMIAMSASRLMLAMAEQTNLFQDVVCKPFEMCDLLDTVERHVFASAWANRA